MSSSDQFDDQANGKQGFWASIKEAYDSLVYTVIRPPRAYYSIQDLGPQVCVIEDSEFERLDLQLRSKSGKKIECSWWIPRGYSKNSTLKLPCIVALHGNSSCRLGALELVYHALRSGFTLFAFDFTGSGLSEGEYVSLGCHESNDIETVISYLRNSGAVHNIMLWGQSMGSVAAMMYVERDPGISAMVLDSPFASLPQLANELVQSGQLNVPKIAVNVVMRLVRGSIKKKADFDMYKLKPVATINKCSIPTFFGVATEDELIPNHHVEQLYEQHRGPKKIYRFSGGHNCMRPEHFFSSAIHFMRAMTGLPTEIEPKFTTEENGSTTAIKIQDPLPPGVSVDSIYDMKIKDLKEMIEKTGFSHETCFEKKDLIDLVIRIHRRYLSIKGAQDKSIQQQTEDTHQQTDHTDSLGVDQIKLENISTTGKSGQ